MNDKKTFVVFTDGGCDTISKIGASAVIRNFEKAGFDCTEEKIALSKAQSIFNKSKTS